MLWRRSCGFTDLRYFVADRFTNNDWAANFQGGRTYLAVTPTLEQGLPGGLTESRVEKAPWSKI